MKFHELPKEVEIILSNVGASPRLVAHLTLVHDTAIKITNRIKTVWPDLEYDVKAVLIGAATHDIGKAIFKEELSTPGKQHEEIGPKLLVENGLSESYARFARTHSQWQTNEVGLEDLLVALADKIWKGQRNPELETALITLLADKCNQEPWVVYSKLDDLVNEITKDADARLLWQSQFSVTS